MKIKDKFYKELKSRLQVLIAKGVEVKFNTFKPTQYSEGHSCIGFPMGTNEAPNFPKNLTINLFISKSRFHCRQTNSS